MGNILKRHHVHNKKTQTPVPPALEEAAAVTELAVVQIPKTTIPKHDSSSSTPVNDLDTDTTDNTKSNVQIQNMQIHRNVNPIKSDADNHLPDNKQENLDKEKISGGGSGAGSKRKGSSIELDLPRLYKVNWERTGVLGKGHFATVFSGECQATARPVAVKRIERHLCEASSLKTEIRALCKVRGHPNIVEIYDVFFNNKYVVLVLERLEGGELFERIVSSGAYSEQDAANHFAKLASALDYMHKRGVVHRDLKPENLVLTSRADDAEIKISDFGLSKIIDNATNSASAQFQLMQTVCGTKAYSAPEVNLSLAAVLTTANRNKGKAEAKKTEARLLRTRYTAKVDTWSLGCILYVILAAYHPFDPYGQNNEIEMYRRIKSASFDFKDEAWNKISQEAKDLIQNLLTVDVEKRFSASEILTHKWITNRGSMPSTPVRLASYSSMKNIANN